MDLEEIRQVVSLYALALDSHDWDLFDDIFTADLECDYVGEMRWSNLASFKADFARLHESTAGHQHFLATPYVVIEGDRAFALTYGRWRVFRTSPAREALDLSEGGAWYDDELISTPAGWRIKRRTARNFWRSGTLPEAGGEAYVVDSFPEWAKAGRVAYINAFRRQKGARS